MDAMLSHWSLYARASLIEQGTWCAASQFEAHLKGSGKRGGGVGLDAGVDETSVGLHAGRKTSASQQLHHSRSTDVVANLQPMQECLINMCRNCGS